MSCTNCGPKPGPECGYAYPYSGFFYDRYPPLRCPDDFYRQEMCDHLSEGFGCGMMPPAFYPPHLAPPPPPGTRGDIPTRPQFQQPPAPVYQVQPIPVGNQPRSPGGSTPRSPEGSDPRSPGGSGGSNGTATQPRVFASPRGTVGCGATPMNTVITPQNMRDYYNYWTRIRSIKPYMPVPYTVPIMSCNARYMGDGSSPSGCSQPRRYAPMIRTGCNIPPGLVGDGPVTTRPPPLDDPEVNAADEAYEQAQDDLDEAAASGSQSDVDAAQTAVNNARNALGRVLDKKGISWQDYENAKAAEAAAAAELAQQQTDTQTGGAAAEQSKSMHPAWYLGIAAVVAAAGYAGYKAGGG